MYESTFSVAIKSDGKCINGQLQEIIPNIEIGEGKVEFDKYGEVLNFDPTTIIGDLVLYKNKTIPFPDKTDYKNVKIRKIDGKLKLIANSLQELSFGIPLNIYDAIPYLETIEILNAILQNKRSISIDEIKALNPLFDLNWSLHHAVKNPLFEKLDDMRRRSSRPDYNQREIYNKVSENDFSKKQKHAMYATCDSMCEVLYFLLYYFLMCDYTFHKCSHCGNFFARRTMKFIHCNRLSTYKGFKHLSCEKAVRDIRQRQSRKKNRILTESMDTSNWDRNFDNKCNEYERVIREQGASVANLSNYDLFLGIEPPKKDILVTK